MGTRPTTIRFEDNPSRSIPLDFDLFCQEAIRPIANWIAPQAESARSPNGVRPTSLVKAEKAANLVLANLINALGTSRRCFVGISRRPEAYTPDERYQTRAISHPIIVGVLDWLHAARLVEYVPGFYDRRQSTPVGFVSRYKASDLLVNVLNRYRELTAGPAASPEIDLDALFAIANNSNDATNSFSVPHEWKPEIKSTKDCIRLKNTEGNLARYQDDESTNAMRERLLQWNEFAALHHIDILIPDDDLENLFQRHELDEGVEENAFFSDEKERPEFVQLERIALHRVFNNGSFQEGGRFYGGWWQQVPSRLRRYITINNHPTREIDYSNLHLAMIYAQEGLPLAGDAYIIDGLDARYRKLVKVTLLKLINAPPGTPISPPRGSALPDGLRWDDLQERIIAKHSAIANYFRSGIGIKLQKIDSNVAEDVMMTMMETDHLALPIHDSFITYSGLTDRLSGLMKSSYHRHMRAEIGVDVDLTFLESEVVEESLPPDEEYPDLFDLIDGRSSDPAYVGYKLRLDQFRSTRSPEWIERFSRFM